MSSSKPISLKKEDANKLVAEELNPLREFSTDLEGLVASLQATVDKADASISTVEKANQVLKTFEDCKKRLTRVRNVLKTRCQSRLRELV